MAKWQAGNHRSYSPSAFLRFARLRLSFQPIVYILTDFILGEAVTLLDSTFQLIALSVHLRKIVVGELAPLLLDLALGLFSVSFNTVPIHRSLRIYGCRQANVRYPTKVPRTRAKGHLLQIPAINVGTRTSHPSWGSSALIERERGLPVQSAVPRFFEGK
jgi:hypothetical protein